MEDPKTVTICTIPFGMFLTHEMCMALLQQHAANGGKLSQAHAEHIMQEFQPQVTLEIGDAESPET